MANCSPNEDPYTSEHWRISEGSAEQLASFVGSRVYFRVP